MTPWGIVGRIGRVLGLQSRPKVSNNAARYRIKPESKGLFLLSLVLYYVFDIFFVDHFLWMHDLNGSKRVTKVMKQYVSKAEKRAMWNGRQKLFRREPVLQLLWALASFVPLTHFQHHIFLCEAFTVKRCQILLERVSNHGISNLNIHEVPTMTSPTKSAKSVVQYIRSNFLFKRRAPTQPTAWKKE